MVCLLDESMVDAQQCETAYPIAYPWNDDRWEDLPRFFRKDGWWENSAAPKNGKALICCMGDLICEGRLVRANRYGDTAFSTPCFSIFAPF